MSTVIAGKPPCSPPLSKGGQRKKSPCPRGDKERNPLVQGGTRKQVAMAQGERETISMVKEGQGRKFLCFRGDEETNPYAPSETQRQTALSQRDRETKPFGSVGEKERVSLSQWGVKQGPLIQGGRFRVVHRQKYKVTAGIAAPQRFAPRNQ